QKLADADPTNATAQRALSLSHEKIGNMLAKSGDTKGALESYRDLLAIAQKRADADPANANAQRDLLASFSKLGTVFERMGTTDAEPTARRIEHWREARAWYVRVAEQFERMKQRNILSPEDAKLEEEVHANPTSCDEAIAEIERIAATQSSTQPLR
ncbi:MAG: hypothetical protein ACREJC_12835, partial [Tepidisphaeraceae bacterium]